MYSNDESDAHSALDPHIGFKLSSTNVSFWDFTVDSETLRRFAREQNWLQEWSFTTPLLPATSMQPDTGRSADGASADVGGISRTGARVCESRFLIFLLPRGSFT